MFKSSHLLLAAAVGVNPVNRLRCHFENLIHKHWNDYISGICQWISVNEVSKCEEKKLFIFWQPLLSPMWILRFGSLKLLFGNYCWVVYILFDQFSPQVFLFFFSVYCYMISLFLTSFNQGGGGPQIFVLYICVESQNIPYSWFPLSRKKKKNLNENFAPNLPVNKVFGGHVWWSLKNDPFSQK